MGKVSWRKGVEIIQPHIVKISTPRGFGTGFLCTYAGEKKFCAIATAAHVISESHIWEEPIRIHHYVSGEVRLLREPDRIVWLDYGLDTAVILFVRENLPLPEDTLPFISEKNYLKVGEQIGWVGFPAVSSRNLCFFSGMNSCWIGDTRTYLVDGVAINGVSGGPAFYTTTKGIKVIGSVTAYLPHRTGVTPGLSMISDVDQFLDVIRKIKDWDEAKKKETPREEVREKKEKEEKEEKEEQKRKEDANT